jgi:aerobic carbon-monoxide dehydrogenase large subunit
MTDEPTEHKPILRLEDPPLLRGEGRFSDDLRLDGQTTGVFVRSVHAHARILGISSEEAEAFPGVIAVLTAADMIAAGIGNISHLRPQTGRDGRPPIVPHRPALAGERVVHIGEPIALVVAETLAAARDAADLVSVDYDALPAVTQAVEALGSGAPTIWPEAPGNLAFDWAGPAPVPENEAAVEQIIAGARHLVHIRTVNQRLAGMPLEPRGATAVFDAESGHFTLHAPSQGAHVLKAQLVGILGVEPSRLRVLSGHVGGAFGLKTPPYPEYAALLVAAQKLGRPVHWMSTRSEAFLSDHQARDQVSEATLALDDDGRFLALRVTAVTNLGAYVTTAGAGIATASFANCFPEMYDIPRVSVGVRLAFTNTVPTGPYRGAGRPESNYVMERLVDTAARQLGINSIDLRRRNLIAPAAMPYRSAIGNIYDSGDFAAALTKALDLAKFEGFTDRRTEAARHGRLRGIGVSCFLEHAGAAGSEGAVLAVEDGRLIVRLGMQPSGQGQATLFRELVARRLDIPPEQIVVEQGDSDLPIKGGPAVGSRSTASAGGAIVAGVGQLIETATGLAAELLNVDPSTIVYQDGRLQIANTNHRLTLFELADRLAHSGKPQALIAIAQADTVTTFPNCCHIAEVEIDPETGHVDVVGYAAVDDCGVVLDETLAESQVTGGIVQGLGQALMESIVYDDDGQLLTGSLQDYAVPRAADVPAIDAAFSPTPCRTNPLGVKGVGEAGSTAAIAAVMNAIADAIPGGHGTNIDMPATPEKIWRACNEVR